MHLPAVLHRTNRYWKADGVVHLLALLTFVMAVVNFFSAVAPGMAHRHHWLSLFVPLAVRQSSRLLTVMISFFLIILSQHLWRRKLVAWYLTMGLLVLSIATHLFKALDIEEALFTVLLLGLLLRYRYLFSVRSDDPSFRQAWSLILTAVVFVFSYGVIGFYFLDRHFHVNYSLPSAVDQTFLMFTQFSFSGIVPTTSYGRYFADSIYAIALYVAMTTLFLVLRPVLIRNRVTAAERARARAIVEQWGRSAIARYTLFEDKRYFFYQSSVVAYVHKNRTALTLGDPIGPPEEARETILQFQAMCRANDWIPVFFQTLADQLETYKEAGFKVLTLGHEAIVDLSTFDLVGKKKQDLRTARNKFTKLGYTIQFHEPEHSVALLTELQAISDEWLAHMHGREQYFSLGAFDPDYLQTCRLITVTGPEGRIVAFANYMREYARDEVTVDLMRHRTVLENGLMDYLFLGLIEHAQSEGHVTFNFGLSPLAGVGEHPDDPLAEKALNFIFDNMNQFYNFRGLHGFKAKFLPRWEPRYLVFPAYTALPSTGLALVRAQTGALTGLWGTRTKAVRPSETDEVRS